MTGSSVFCYKLPQKRMFLITVFNNDCNKLVKRVRVCFFIFFGTVCCFT